MLLLMIEKCVDFERAEPPPRLFVSFGLFRVFQSGRRMATRLC